jgi:hypothetical protein
LQCNALQINKNTKLILVGHLQDVFYRELIKLSAPSLAQGKEH